MGGSQSAEHPVVELYITARLNQLTLRELLQKQQSNQGLSIDGIGRRGDSAMTFAAHVGDSGTVKLLRDHGSNLIQQGSGNFYKRTPLHTALAAKQEHVAVFLYNSSEYVRAVLFNEDSNGKTPIHSATKHRLYYSLWLMLIQCHTYSAFPLRILGDFRTWSDLSYTHYARLLRDCIAIADPTARLPLLFASFGLPANVYISGDRQNYGFHQKSTQNLYGLWPHSFKYINPVNLAQPPIMSTPLGMRCPVCTTDACQSNECVLVCLLGHFHQFKEFLVNGVLSGVQPGQILPPPHRGAVIDELAKFLKLTNQTPTQIEQQTYHLPNQTVVQELLPSFVLPPPILLSTAIQDQYLCTRTKCVCHQPNPQQPQCYVYPPLLSIPIYPLNQLTPGGYHNGFCSTLALDSQQKTASITSPNSTILKSKSNPHSHDIISLHLDYITQIQRSYRITPVILKTSTGLCQEVTSPGFSVPVDYQLARYIDGTTEPAQGRPKAFAEKAHGFFSGIKDLAASTFGNVQKFEDGNRLTTLDQSESVLINNIRYHSNRMPLDTRFTSVIVGEKRDHISPMRMTEQPVNDVFSSMYPPNAPQVVAYEHTPPILDSTYTTNYKLSNREKPSFEAVHNSHQDYARQRPQLPPTLYPPMPEGLSRRTVDLTRPIAPISQKEPYQYEHSQTCLCGAHTTNIQPIQLHTSKVALNVDGRSLRITSSNESEIAINNPSAENPFSTVLLSSLTPHTSIMYRPSKHGFMLNLRSYDYGIPALHKMFENLAPPLNPSHDISSTDNNPNQSYWPAKDGTKARFGRDVSCPMGACYESAGSSSAANGVDFINNIGDVIISPNQHISIVFPLHVRSVIFFTSSIHRVLQTKYPHYMLYSQWHRFTTRISAAVQRLAQRRMTMRLQTSELNLLNIFHSDLSFLSNVYKTHYGDYLNNPGTTAQLSVAIPYFQRQTEMFDAYLILLERYIDLRNYRLSTSQYTPGVNILAMLGNVIATGEYDIELFKITNPRADQGAGFNNPNSGTKPEHLEQDPKPYIIEEFLTSKATPGADILTNIPTPLLPGMDPNKPITTTAPPGTSTLASFLTQSNDNFHKFGPHYVQQLEEFKQIYPKLAINPNGSILAELDQYYNQKKLWQMHLRNPVASQNTPTQPKPFVQPFTLIENFMLDTFIAIIPNIIRGFVQKLQGTIAGITTVMNNPNATNSHKINYIESIQILTHIQTQAILLDQWLCLPEISPHFHSRTHQFQIRQPEQILMMLGSAPSVVNKTGVGTDNIKTPEVVLPLPGQHRQALGIDPHSTFTPVHVPTPQHQQPQQQPQQQQQQQTPQLPPRPQQTQQQQAVMTMQLPQRPALYPTIPADINIDNNNNIPGYAFDSAAPGYTDYDLPPDYDAHVGGYGDVVPELMTSAPVFKYYNDFEHKVQDHPANTTPRYSTYETNSFPTGVNQQNDNNQARLGGGDNGGAKDQNKQRENQLSKSQQEFSAGFDAFFQDDHAEDFNLMFPAPPTGGVVEDDEVAPVLEQYDPVQDQIQVPPL
jgi:hypothetical protein